MSETAPSKLLSNPSELRLLIYEYLWTGCISSAIYIFDETFHVSHSQWAAGKQPSISHKELALPLTCKKLYTEALPVVFGKTEYRFITSGYQDRDEYFNALRNYKPFPEEATFLPHIRKISIETLILEDGDSVQQQHMVNAFQTVKSLVHPSCGYGELTMLAFHMPERRMNEQTCDFVRELLWPGKVVINCGGMTST